MNMFARRNPAFILLCLIIMLLPAIGAFQWLPVHPWAMRLYFLMVAAPLLLWLVVKRGQVTLGIRVPLLLPVWIIAVLAIFTAFFAVDQYDAWLGAARWFLLLLLGIAAYNLVKRERGLEQLMFCAAIGGGYMALIVVLQYLFGMDIYVTSTGYPWPGGTSGHKNQAASFVILTLPITIYMIRISCTIWKVWLFKIVLAMMSAALVYALARQSFVALILELIALILVFRYVCPSLFRKQSLPSKANKYSTFFACLLFISLIAMPPHDKPFGLQNNAVTYLLVKSQTHYRKGVDLDTAAKGRFETWSNTIAMLPATWYGVGALNWQVYYPKYSAVSEKNYNLGRQFYWRFAHNDYLQTLVEFGVLSIIAGALLLYGLYSVCRLAIVNGSDEERYQIFSIAVSMLGLFTIMFFSMPMSMTIQPAYLCIFLGGMSAYWSRWIKGKSDVAIPSSKLWTPVLLAISMVGGYVGYRMAGGWYYAASGEFVHRYIEKALFDKEKYPDVSSHHDLMTLYVELSAKMDPYHPRLDMMRGGMLAYIAITTDGDREKKDWYIEKSFEYLNKVRKAFPYYAFPDIVDSQIYASLGQIENQKESLERVLKLAPGDVVSVKTLTFIYLENKKYDLAFNLLNDFFERFYDFELLSVYAFAAQQTEQQRQGVKKLAQIELERFINPRMEEDNFKKSTQKLNELIYALKQQIIQKKKG